MCACACGHASLTTYMYMYTELSRKWAWLGKNIGPAAAGPAGPVPPASLGETPENMPKTNTHHAPTHIHTHTHTYTRIHTHTHTYTHIHTHTHAYIHTHAHIHTYTCTHTHTHTHTHIHTHTYTCILMNHLNTDYWRIHCLSLQHFNNVPQLINRSLPQTSQELQQRDTTKIKALDSKVSQLTTSNRQLEKE